MENQIEQTFIPTSEERIFAAIAHGSSFLFGFGSIISLIMYLIHREKSKWVTFHAIQAMLYQPFQIIFTIAWHFLVFLPLNFGLMILDLNRMDGGETMPLFMFTMFPLMFGGIGLTILLGFIGAAFCFMGKDFRYPVLGKFIENYLAGNSRFQRETNDTVSRK